MKRFNLLLAFLIAAAVSSLLPANAGAADSASAELAKKYAPVMMIREQDDPLCGTRGEQYQVMAIDALFDNPNVKLMEIDGKDDRLITRAPSKDDLTNRGEEAYLDMPGSPLSDTCVYARSFDEMKRAGKAPDVVYAHIAREDGRSGIALQYWFYWYFNQFNDVHESDWEGMQITFDADTPEEALTQDPQEMILFQHAGGERAGWNDPKVEKEGSHPVVYPAAGSHATFYQSAIYPQNGAHGSGVGCDNTSDPLRELRPQPVLLPDKPTDQGEFSWLSFDGRWGQRENLFNNGPTGPQTKDQWAQPFTWMEQQRWSSPRMPAAGLVGPDVVNTFCDVIEGATGVMNLQQADPWLAYAIIVAFLLGIYFVFGYSTWRPADPDNLHQERAYGQITSVSLKLYRRHLKAFAVLGAIGIPIVAGAQIFGNLLGDIARGNALIQSASDLVLGTGTPIALALVSAFVIVYLRDLDQGEEAGVKRSIRGTLERFWRLVIAKFLVLMILLLLTVTVIGIPFAIRLLVSWSFVQQEVVFTNLSVRDSLKASRDLVRGQWWRALRTVVPLSLVLAIVGPLLGLILIFSSLPLVLVTLIGSLAYGLSIPFVATGITVLYFDLKVRDEVREEVPRRSWLPWRPSQFGRRIDQPAA